MLEMDLKDLAEKSRKGLLNFIYSLKDSKAGTFGNPFVASNDEMARRMVSDFVNNSGDSVVSLHPEDFSLYILGSYDVHTGEIISNSVDFLYTLDTLKKKSA